MATKKVDKNRAYEMFMKTLFALYPDKDIAYIEKYILGMRLTSIRELPAEKILEIKRIFDKRFSDEGG